MNLNNDTYIIKIMCDYEGTTSLLMNLSPYELNSLKFIENISDKLAKSGSHPYLAVEKFPYEDYKKHKLNSMDQAELKEIVADNRKAYNKIKNEIKKQLKKAPKQSGIKVE